MKFYADYHTHTPYSHGKNTVLENATVAKEKGFLEVAITDHGFNHFLFGMKRRKLPDLKAEIKEAKEKLGINVLLGVEANIISFDGQIDLTKAEQEDFDIVLCGVHRAVVQKGGKNYVYSNCINFLARLFLWGKSYKKFKEKQKARTIALVVNALKNNKIDILTHPGRYLDVDLIEVAKACKKYGTMFEINTKSCQLSDEEIKEIAKTGVTFVVGSDAHSKERVGDFEKYQKRLENLIDQKQIFNAQKQNFKKINK